MQSIDNVYGVTDMFKTSKIVASMTSDRTREFFLRAVASLDAAIEDGIIFNADYNDIKDVLNRCVDAAFTFYMGEMFAYGGRYQDLSAEDKALYDEIRAYNLHDCISAAKKLAKFTHTSPMMTEVSELMAQCLPLAVAMKGLKDKVVKGRKPAANKSAPKSQDELDADSPDVQLRGHCQCCGNQQAVLDSGNMSKHGYTVEQGWFNGVCVGQNHAPIEQDRTVADQIVADVREQVADMRETAMFLRTGKMTPKTCGTGEYTYEGIKRVEKMVAFKDGDKHHRQQAVEQAVWEAESRARAGEQFANALEAITNANHGKPLLKVEKPKAPKYIARGDKKMSANGQVMIALYQDGARVYYYFKGDVTSKNDGSGTATVNRKYWIGTTAWSGLVDAE